MPTTVVKTIGSGGGRDFSTLQAWEDACPANLVTADQVWQGQCYNDSEFVASSATLLTIAGETTDSTRYLELTSASGQSFQDAAGVRTNLLAYNQSNGVAFRVTGGYAFTVISVNTDYTRINRLQIYAESNNRGITLSASNCLFKDLIIQVDSGSGRYAVFASGSFNLHVNVVAFMAGTADYAFHSNGNANKYLACAAVRTTDQSTSGTGFLVDSYLGNAVLISCCSFGFTDPATASLSASCSNNATDQASGFSGSSNQYLVTFNATTPFKQAAVSGYDLRAVAATALAGNGVLDSTNAPNDITGKPRPASPTIGVWQLDAATVVSVPFIDTCPSFSFKKQYVKI